MSTDEANCDIKRLFRIARHGAGIFRMTDLTEADDKALISALREGRGWITLGKDGRIKFRSNREKDSPVE